MEPESHAFLEGKPNIQTSHFGILCLFWTRYLCLGIYLGHTQDVPGFVTHHSALHIWFIQNVLRKSLRAFWGTSNDQHTSVSTSPLLKRSWLPIYVFLISSLCSCQLLWHVHPVRACSGHMGCIACFLGGGFVSQPDTKKTFDFARGSQGPANRIL